MVEWEDINRLLSEISLNIEGKTPEQTVEEWAALNDVDQEIIFKIADNSMRLLATTLEVDIPDASREELIVAGVQSLGVMYFMLGWDAHKQYGRR